MMFELQKAAALDARRRKGLALSVGIHVLMLLFLVLNPDFLSTSSRRVVRVEGEDYDRDRFEVVELQLPPELAAPLPEVVEAPVPEVVVPAPEVEATPPPPPPPEPEPELPPPPPPPVIGPDDIVAEGARPDAPAVPVEPPEPAELEPPESNPGEPGDGGGPFEPDIEPAPAEPAEEEVLEIADNTNLNSLVVPNLRRQAASLIDETVARSPRSVDGERGDGSDNVIPNLTTDRPEILSDTRGYDFGPYMNQVINRVRTNWYLLIPEAARIGTLRGRVIIVFTITSNGRIENLRAVAPSGATPLDRAAAGAIQASNPFPELPADFDGGNLVLQFTFLYNMPEQQ